MIKMRLNYFLDIARVSLGLLYHNEKYIMPILNEPIATEIIPGKSSKGYKDLKKK